MKKTFAFALLLLFAATPTLAQAPSDAAAVASPGMTPTAFDQPTLVKRYQDTITEADLAAHLFTFASDFFEGRETATRGQKLAATYLAGQYRKMGLLPKGNMTVDHPLAPEAYFQPFPLYGRRLAEATLTVSAGGETVAESHFSLTEQDDLAYLALGNATDVTGPVVFGGYGIADDDLGYDDFAALKARGIEHQGKWLLILRDEPLASAEQSLLPTEEGGPSSWTTSPNNKFRSLFRAGLPKGVLIVGDVGPRVTSSMLTRARKAAEGQQGMGNLSLKPQAAGFALPPFYVISSEMANKILAPTGQTIDALQADINNTLEPVVFEVGEVEVSSTLVNEAFETTSENVLAFIEGSDPSLKEEVVVISSHYDHIGINPALDGDTINNGADDDGSGTVAMLEMAEAFMQAKRDGYGPRRSILFLNVSGEEKGLLGSAYFSDIEPLVPIDQIVTNLNIDMIGRFDPTHPDSSENYVYIIGSNLISQELHDINLRINEITGTALELDERFNSKSDPNRFYARSDHWNFGKHGIPFIFFFTGTHDDYHQPGDEAHKIEYERMKRITQLIFATAWQVANQEARPAVTGQGFN